MFRDSFDHSTAGDEASTASEELTIPADAQEAASTIRPTGQTTPTSAPMPIASHNPPPQAAEDTTRPLSNRRSFSHPIINFPPQVMTTLEIEAGQRNLQTGQPHPYEPSRAAHTIHPSYPIQLNGFQSTNTPHPPTPTPTTIARPVLIPSPPLLLNTSVIKTLLLPMQLELDRLKRAKIPPQNGKVHAKRAMQVLKERLLPVGKYLVQRLGEMEGEEEGSEGEICRYIADNYWPQQLVRADGLWVMEMYRNAIFLEKIERERGVEVDEEEKEEKEEARQQEVWQQEVWQQEVWQQEVDRGGFVYDDAEEEDIPGLVGEAVWEQQAVEEVWRPVATREEAWEHEIDETDEEDEGGGVELTDDSYWVRRDGR